MTTFANYQVLYWTFNHYVTATDTEENAVIYQYFDSPFIQKCSDWLLSVERFELNLNNVPFFQITTTNQRMSWKNRHHAEIGPVVFIPVGDYFSLQHLIMTINEVIGEPPEIYAKLGKDRVFVMGISPEGHVYIQDNNLHSCYLSLHADLLELFDMTQEMLDPRNIKGSRGLGVAVFNGPNYYEQTHYYGVEADDGTYPEPQILKNSVYNIYSKTPRYDCGDNMMYVQLQSNIPVVSDTVGQIQQNVLTDFVYPQSYGVSVSMPQQSFYNNTLSYSARQKIVYTPSERRILNMNSSGPLTSIRISARYVDKYGVDHLIKLRQGMCFNIKLAFFSRK